MDICEDEISLNISELKGYLPNIDKEFESANQETQRKSQISNIGINIKSVKTKSARKNIA
jgi:hypothetical protein